MANATTIDRPTLSARLAALIAAHVSVHDIIDRLEDDEDVQQEWYRLGEAMFHQMADRWPHVVAARQSMKQIDDSWVIEGAARRAGFMVGFEYCRRLLREGGAL